MVLKGSNLLRVTVQESLLPISYKVSMTSRLALSEQTKLGLFTVAFVLCLATLFTSHGGGDLPRANARMGQYCQTERKTARACQEDCQPAKMQLEKCESTVKQAFRRINLGGCPWELQTVALCEDEWCRGGASMMECQEECSTVRSQLNTCMENIINAYLKKGGFEV